MNGEDEESGISKETNEAPTTTIMTNNEEMREDEEEVSASGVSNEETVDKANLFKSIVNCVANSKAVFKSQQKNDPDLTMEEKMNIVTELLRKSQPMFLSRFGRFLKEEHLLYFNDIETRDYEIMFHVNRVRRYLNYSQRQIDVKNRRYQALKSMIDKGEYFSETEMMRRNPLLYEHLIGQYLTEEQKKARDNIDTQNITFVNLLLESIVRDGTRNLKKEQEEAENDVTEENDSDEEDVDNDDEEYKTTDVRWGEMSGQTASFSNSYEKQEREKKNIENNFPREISSKERQVLRDEFFTNMYHSFLNGRDKDFDYSTVDDDEAYDNVDLRNQDEEEKYFDSESPETVEEDRMEEGGLESGEEDELDKYMKSLQEQPSPNQLADEVEKQTIH